jgi:hypothetical protein
MPKAIIQTLQLPCEHCQFSFDKPFNNKFVFIIFKRTMIRNEIKQQMYFISSISNLNDCDPKLNPIFLPNLESCDPKLNPSKFNSTAY